MATKLAAKSWLPKGLRRRSQRGPRDFCPGRRGGWWSRAGMKFSKSR